MAEFYAAIDKTSGQATVHKDTCPYPRTPVAGPFDTVGNALVASIEVDEAVTVVLCCRVCFRNLRVALLAVR